MQIEICNVLLNILCPLFSCFAHVFPNKKPPFEAFWPIAPSSGVPCSPVSNAMADYEGDVCFCLPRWSGLIVVILLLFAGESFVSHTRFCMDWWVYDAQGEIRQCWRRWCPRRPGGSAANAADAANAGNGRDEQQELGDWHELD